MIHEGRPQRGLQSKIQKTAPSHRLPLVQAIAQMRYTEYRCNPHSGVQLRFILGFGDPADPISGAAAVMGNGQDEQAIVFD